ncbi:4-hydroxy-tetrahydrodipicolinate synthase [Sphingomonas zeicaulis]|uniref:dihydrodipicolinate synthase family protein n=1 Tax=Sphingomonas zeicaulis TaxID=1632740 RepID=UPI003D18FF0A
MSAGPAVAGVYCAAFTAIDAHGGLDLGRTAGHARSLIEQGCDGVALLGTTGEANSLSQAERRAVLEAAIAAGVPANRLLPGTSACAIGEAVELTRHARACGVETVLLLPPFYYPDPTLAGLVDFYSRVIDATAADGLRVLLYHIPQMTGVPITAELIMALLDRYPGVIVGLKDSGGDLDRMIALVDAFPDFAVLAGADHLLGPLLRAGGAGCITATSNLIAPLLAELHGRIMRGEGVEATRALERHIGDTRSLFQRWPQIAALKAAHALIQGDPAWANVRPPLQSLDIIQQAELRDVMVSQNMLNDQTLRENIA